MKNLLIVFILCLGVSVTAQHRVGVRAGLNYSKFTGPLETNESYGITGGFHFGINYTYELNDVLGFRGELLYTQRGTEQKYLGDSYYIVNPITAEEAFVELGNVDMNLKISNAYLSIPITVNYRLNKKFEFFGGASVDFVVGPTGRGKVKFISESDPNNITFTQSFDHRYNSDLAGDYNRFIDLTDNVQVRVDGETIILPRIINAYYNYQRPAVDESIPSRINSFDSHLIAGVNYYINSGFYFGARLEYGLLDVTNNFVDKSLGALDADDKFIFRDDKDQSFNIALSFGFKF